MKGLQGIADQAKAAGIRVAWIHSPARRTRDPGAQSEWLQRDAGKSSPRVWEIAEKTAACSSTNSILLGRREQGPRTALRCSITGGDRCIRDRPGGP